MSLHPHQHRALVRELASPDYDGRSPGEVFDRFRADPKPLLARLGRVRFLTPERLQSLPPKRRPAGVVPLTAEEAALFPTGVPGFPNKLRREWFDRAWSEARLGD